MAIPIEDPDPKSKLIEFKRGPRIGNLEPVRKKYDSCKHERVTVDEGTRSVACSACKAPLDPFAVLYELAWKQRRWLQELDAWDAYRDSKLSERYDEVWEEKRGDVVDPPADAEDLRVWQTFRDYLKNRFCGMYKLKANKRRGPLWYGRTVDGGCVSYEYARSRLIPTASNKQGA